MNRLFPAYKKRPADALEIILDFVLSVLVAVRAVRTLLWA
jgi:hypothetical protein